MPGIYIAAAITTALSLLIIGGAIWKKTPVKYHALLLVALAAQLPMSAVAFYYVRIPLDRFLVGWLGASSQLYKYLTTLYAPLTEETAKVWPLLIPVFYRRIDKRNAVCVAMALGLGFGLGEIWFLAERVSHAPEIARLPWYLLGGFITERFMVCVMHGVFTATALKNLRGRFYAGLLMAMALHFMGNFPIFMAAEGYFGWGRNVWQYVLSFWVPVYFLLMLLLLVFLMTGKVGQVGRVLLGRRVCPACQERYDIPLFGFNMGPVRYERCSRCKKWHWVR